MKFPNDCPKACQHYHRWDMSVDDYTNFCDLLYKQVDDCDSDFIKYDCPMEKMEGLDAEKEA